MNENPRQPSPDKTPIQNLSDFAVGVDAKNHLDIEVAVNDKGKVVVFHNRAFKTEVTWFEFDLTKRRLNFVMEGGEMRDAGLPMTEQMAKHMQNSHQILMVLLDNETGEATQGNFVPLIIHRS